MYLRYFMIDWLSGKKTPALKFDPGTINIYDVKPKMYLIFKSLHPPNELMKGSGVMNKCFVALKANFPDYHDEILKHTSEVLTFQRLRLINKRNMKKSKDCVLFLLIDVQKWLQDIPKSFDVTFDLPLIRAIEVCSCMPSNFLQFLFLLFAWIEEDIFIIIKCSFPSAHALTRAYRTVVSNG